jgi:hypothetical protein
MAVISNERLLTRLSWIEAKYGKIDSLNGCDFDDMEDPRAKLVEELVRDMYPLSGDLGGPIKRHQFLLFRAAMDAAFHSVLTTVSE